MYLSRLTYSAALASAEGSPEDDDKRGHAVTTEPRENPRDAAQNHTGNVPLAMDSPSSVRNRPHNDDILVPDTQPNTQDNNDGEIDPGSQSAVPSSHETVPSSQSTVPSSQSTVPSSQETVPSSQSTVPSTFPEGNVSQESVQSSEDTLHDSQGKDSENVDSQDSTQDTEPEGETGNDEISVGDQMADDDEAQTDGQISQDAKQTESQSVFANESDKHTASQGNANSGNEDSPNQKQDKRRLNNNSNVDPYTEDFPEESHSQSVKTKMTSRKRLKEAFDASEINASQNKSQTEAVKTTKKLQSVKSASVPTSPAESENIFEIMQREISPVKGNTDDSVHKTTDKDVATRSNDSEKVGPEEQNSENASSDTTSKTVAVNKVNENNEVSKKRKKQEQPKDSTTAQQNNSKVSEKSQNHKDQDFSSDEESNFLSIQRRKSLLPISQPPLFDSEDDDYEISNSPLSVGRKSLAPAQKSVISSRKSITVPAEKIAVKGKRKGASSKDSKEMEKPHAETEQSHDEEPSSTNKIKSKSKPKTNAGKKATKEKKQSKLHESSDDETQVRSKKPQQPHILKRSQVSSKETEESELSEKENTAKGSQKSRHISKKSKPRGKKGEATTTEEDEHHSDTQSQPQGNIYLFHYGN